MEREIFVTDDGSSSLHIPQWNEQYHSKYGAVQEARHVFMESGLVYWLDQSWSQQTLSVLEVGFGTGLNALLTALFATSENLTVHYTGLEAYPLSRQEWTAMNYPHYLKNGSASALYAGMFAADWEQFVSLSKGFYLKKKKQRFEDFSHKEAFDLIYFDAFSARLQPELWTIAIFENMYKALRKNGVLVTYSAKGSVRRNMQEVGFWVKKISGPPGKREMLRAVKKT